MMKLNILVIAIVMLSGFLSAQAQPQPCGCDDKQDLLNLLNMADRAIQEYDLQLNLLTGREQETGQTVLNSNQNFDELQRIVHDAINSVRGQSSTEYGLFQLNYNNCSFKEKNTSNECLRQIEKSLFDVQKRECEATKNLPVNESPYLRMRQVIQYEKAAFQEMRNFIMRILRALPKDCRPDNWFGYVVYQKISTQVSNKTIPGQTAISKPSPGITITTGGNTIQGLKSTYTGTIYVEGGKMTSSRGAAEFTVDSTTSVTGRIYCTKNKPDQTQVESRGTKTRLSGEKEGKAEFQLNVTPAKGYQIYLGFYPVEATGQISSFATISGGCGGNPVINNTPLTRQLDGPGKYTVAGEIEESPDILQGSKIEKPPAENQTWTQGNTSTTKTYEIIVRWNLRRLPKK